MAWHAKEVVRCVHEISDPELAREFADQLGTDLQDESCPLEARSLGRTIVRWRGSDRRLASRLREATARPRPSTT